MKNDRLYKVIISGLSTEKTVRLGEKYKQISFKVAKDATKTEIKEAISKIFNVVVLSVRVMNVNGKVKRFRNKLGKRQDWKKAIVCLAEGHDINLSFNV